jgi:hypothetical protein
MGKKEFKGIKYTAWLWIGPCIRKKCYKEHSFKTTEKDEYRIYII